MRNIEAIIPRALFLLCGFIFFFASHIVAQEPIIAGESRSAIGITISIPIFTITAPKEYRTDVVQNGQLHLGSMTVEGEPKTYSGFLFMLRYGMFGYGYETMNKSLQISGITYKSGGGIVDVAYKTMPSLNIENTIHNFYFLPPLAVDYLDMALGYGIGTKTFDFDFTDVIAGSEKKKEPLNVKKFSFHTGYRINLGMIQLNVGMGYNILAGKNGDIDLSAQTEYETTVLELDPYEEYLSLYFGAVF